MEFTLIEVLLLFICVTLLYLVGRINKIDNYIKGIKYSLDRISKQVDLPEDPLNKELRQLINEGNEGNDVKAVKKTRESLGLSLLEAKQYVDSLKLSL